MIIYEFVAVFTISAMFIAAMFVVWIAANCRMLARKLIGKIIKNLGVVSGR